MKSILLIACLLFSGVTFSQSSAKDYKKAQKEHQAKADTMSFPSPLEFTFIDTCNLTKSELFTKLNQWVSYAFRNLTLADNLKDSAGGKIILPNISSATGSRLRYTITIDVRDNKYRFRFDRFMEYHERYGTTKTIEEAEQMRGIYGAGGRVAFWKSTKLSLMEEAESIYKSAKAYISKKDDF